MDLLQSFYLLAGVLVAYSVVRLAKWYYDESFGSPIKHLPGPPNSSLLYGNLQEIWKAENSVLHEKWVDEYGATFKYKGFFGMNRLYTTDTKALNYVLMNSYDYPKPEAARYNLSTILGNGLLVAEQEKHRQQRKVMNPAFGPSQIRELTEIFVEKSLELRDKWVVEISKNDDKVARVDILLWLSKMTLDVIGLAGFNYKFDSMTREEDELSAAFSLLFQSGTQTNLVSAARAGFPALRPFLQFFNSKRDKEAHKARETVSRIGNQLMKDSKAAITNNNEKGEKNFAQRRDLLSLLLKANMATDLPESHRLSDEDLVAQVPTFLGAGHETTSTATMWALFAMTQNINAQTRLREELLTISSDNPTMDELNALPYLDAVVRETLRIHAPVPSTGRVAIKDDILPLNTPFTDKKGNVHHGIRITKGQTIFIPILVMNRAKSIWGEDSMEFKPERWESIPEAAGSIPGIWGNMLTFLGGPHACIGYRFSLVEMKALLFTLVRAFEFELAVAPDQIIKKASIVQRPVVISEPGKNQMPLLIRPYSRS